MKQLIKKADRFYDLTKDKNLRTEQLNVIHKNMDKISYDDFWKYIIDSNFDENQIEDIFLKLGYLFYDGVVSYENQKDLLNDVKYFIENSYDLDNTRLVLSEIYTHPDFMGNNQKIKIFKNYFLNGELRNEKDVFYVGYLIGKNFPKKNIDIILNQENQLSEKTLSFVIDAIVHNIKEIYNLNFNNFTKYMASIFEKTNIETEDSSMNIDSELIKFILFCYEEKLEAVYFAFILKNKINYDIAKKAISSKNKSYIFKKSINSEETNKTRFMEIVIDGLDNKKIPIKEMNRYIDLNLGLNVLETMNDFAYDIANGRDVEVYEDIINDDEFRKNYVEAYDKLIDLR